MDSVRRIRTWLRTKRHSALAEIATLPLERRMREFANALLSLGGSTNGRHIAEGLFRRPMCVHPDEGVVEGFETALDPTGADQFEMLRAVKSSLPGERLLDFGCGLAADHRDEAERAGYAWHGLEVADTKDPITGPGLRDRAKDTRLTLYDGREIPFPDTSFDVVFSNQSLEHVHDIDFAMGEIARVLTSGGVLIGSVSHLEPFHGYSTFNYTPYGFAMVGRRHGLRMERVSAGIDSLTLITRAVLCQLNQGPDIDRVFETPASKSALNLLIDEACRSCGQDERVAAQLKLNFCAQFRFLLRRTARAEA